MKILHITPHLGGGVGTVIMDWMEKINFLNHRVICLDYANEKAKKALPLHTMIDNLGLNTGHPAICYEIKHFTDIVLVHYWDHPMLAELLSKPLPDCRMVFWCHKNFQVPIEMQMYPDRYIDTSPIQALLPYTGSRVVWKYTHREHIWSTGNMDRFLAIEPKKHKGFNIGTILSKKTHLRFYEMCKEIKKTIPDVRFTLLGEKGPGVSAGVLLDRAFRFYDKVDDVAPYLAEMDVFAYPLRSDHYGTCEIALGEAMCAGVFPVVMENFAERYIVEDGINGYVEPTEADFIDAIKFLSGFPTSPYSRRNIKQRGRALYSIDRMIASWNKVFDEMMQKPKTKRDPL
jgi:glycosyltransferase involved in cell wall biosynthesis